MSCRIGPDRDQHRNLDKICRHQPSVQRFSGKRDQNVRPLFLQKLPQILYPEIKLNKAMSPVIAFPQPNMYAPHPLIRLKFILTIPLRSDNDLISACRKPVSQIGDDAFRAALFQTI